MALITDLQPSPSTQTHHPRLRITDLPYDVLCLIAEELGRDVVGGKHALVQLALACRAFVDPTQPLIWRDLPGLRPLHMLLRYAEESGLGEAASRSRLERYSRHVRSLVLSTMDYSGNYPVEPDATWFVYFQRLCPPQAFPPTIGALLPNLRELDCDLSHDETLESRTSPWCCISSPSVKVLRLDADDHLGSGARRFFSELPVRVPNLQELDLDESWSLELSYPQNSVHMPLQLANLCRLSADLSYLSLGLSIGRFPFFLSDIGRLVYLRVSFTWEDVADISLPSRSLSAPYLTQLDLSVATIQIAPQIVTALDAPSLRSVQIRCTMFSQTATNEMFEDCITVVASRCPNLKSVYLQVVYGVSRHEVYQSSCLIPLYALSSLESVDIGCMAGMQWNHQQLLRLATSWPQLKFLNFASRYTDQLDNPPPNALLSDLQCFVELCPLLEWLGLSLNMRDFVPPNEQPVSASHRMTLCLYSITIFPHRTDTAAVKHLLNIWPEVAITFSEGFPLSSDRDDFLSSFLSERERRRAAPIEQVMSSQEAGRAGGPMPDEPPIAIEEVQDVLLALASRRGYMSAFDYCVPLAYGFSAYLAVIVVLLIPSMCT